MSYSKSVDMKIIRTRHIVSFYDNSRALDILEDLKRVPSEARIIDFRDANDEDSSEAASAHKQHMLVFELEEKQP